MELNTQAQIKLSFFFDGRMIYGDHESYLHDL